MYFHLISFSFVAFVIYLMIRSRKSPSAKLPPGPTRLPILGSIMDLPAKGEPEYQHWLKFKDKYGPISSITALGQTIIILHDKQAAIEILEKTASKSSGRPYFTFSKMCGFHNLLSLKQYDSGWRQQRKMIHQQLGTKQTSLQFNHVQDLESQYLLLRIAKDPQSLIKHIKK